MTEEDDSEQHRARVHSMVGDEIRAIRENKGWSQAKLAEAVGTTQQTINRIESGQITNSSYLSAVFKSLGMSAHLRAHEEGPGALYGHYREYVPRQIESQHLLKVAQRADGAIEVFPLVAWEGEGITISGAIDLIERPAPLKNVFGAYAVLAFSNDMEPAIRPGEVALINPHIRPRRDNDILLLSFPKNGRQRALIRTLVGETDKDWLVRTWNPLNEASIYKPAFPVANVIVGKFSRV